jgi:uncharacterized protein
MRAGARRFKDWLRIILHTDDPPPRAALAFSIGVFVAWTPVFGLHTLIGLAVAFLFGLNRVAVIAGTFINNPWTIVPIYSLSAYFGSLLVGSEAVPPRLEGGLTTWTDVGELFAQLGPWILPLIVGTLVLGSFCALLSFPIALYSIRWSRALRRMG